MMKSLKNMLKQDKEKYTVPKSVHDYIPITAIWEDGIFKVGNKYAKTFRFTDINYLVAGKEDKETMFLCYSELLNSLDSGATTKLTINNRRINKVNFEKEILIPKTGDELDCFREEYNNILLEVGRSKRHVYLSIQSGALCRECCRHIFQNNGREICSDHFLRHLDA